MAQFGDDQFFEDPLGRLIFRPWHSLRRMEQLHGREHKVVRIEGDILAFDCDICLPACTSLEGNVSASHGTIRAPQLLEVSGGVNELNLASSMVMPKLQIVGNLAVKSCSEAFDSLICICGWLTIIQASQSTSLVKLPNLIAACDGLAVVQSQLPPHQSPIEFYAPRLRLLGYTLPDIVIHHPELDLTGSRIPLEVAWPQVEIWQARYADIDLRLAAAGRALGENEAAVGLGF